MTARTKERAEFIEAPEINPNKKTSKPTIAPNAISDALCFFDINY